MSESQNKFEKDGKRVRNDIFNSLGHSMTSSCFYELQTCRDKTKYKNKLLFCLNPFLKLLCLPKVTATASINNFINAMKITTE